MPLLGNFNQWKIHLLKLRFIYFLWVYRYVCVSHVCSGQKGRREHPSETGKYLSYRLCFSPLHSKKEGKDGRLFGRPDREKEILFSWQLALFVMIPLLDEEYCGKIIGESELF